MEPDGFEQSRRIGDSLEVHASDIEIRQQQRSFVSPSSTRCSARTVSACW
jgi:hypothetical protein